MENYQQQGGQCQQPYQQAYDQQGCQQQYGAIPEAPAMSFGDAIKTCFRQYATFTGRATRAEYWWWQLFCVLVTFVASFIILYIILKVAEIFPSVAGWYAPLMQLVSLALFIPSISVSWRRLHDIGKAGGWYFFGLIPVVGWIFMIIWYCTKSEPFDNRFGPYLG